MPRLTHAAAEPRVTLVLPSLDGGGAERVFLNLAGGLLGVGVSVDIVAARLTVPLVSKIPQQVTLYDLGRNRVAYTVPRLASYLRTVRPTCAISALTHTNLALISAAAISRSNVSVVCTEHIALRSAAQEYWKDRLTRRLIRFAYPRATAVVGVSRGIAQELTELIGARNANVTVLPNAIDVQALYRQAADHTVRLPWGAQPFVVAVGRLSPQKDYPTLLEALSAIEASNRPRLLILGDGPERQSLESLIQRLGLEAHVRLAGFVANPYPFIKQASTLVLSSRWEGLPTVLLEAMILGTPVVATDCPTGPRELLDGGRHGVLVRVGDAKGIAIGIRRQLCKPIPPPSRVLAADHDSSRVARLYLGLTARH